jgi:putative solute:sodium symporter small subunit
MLRRNAGDLSKDCKVGVSFSTQYHCEFPAKGGGPMQLTERHEEYWRKNLIITAILLVVWFIVTFVEGWYARELNAITFLGFPLGFYMSAQGSLAIYVVIIGIYARYMNNLDKEYGVDEGEDA